MATIDDPDTSTYVKLEVDMRIGGVCATLADAAMQGVDIQERVSALLERELPDFEIEIFETHSAAADPEA